MEKFSKLLESRKKDSKPMSDTEKKAKMSVLEHVRGMASDMMKDRLSGGMKKVEVASDSKEGLLAGLSKAKEAMSGSELDLSDAEDTTEEEEAEMDAQPEESEDDDQSDSQDEIGSSDEEDELDGKLAKLMSLKKSMGAKS